MADCVGGVPVARSAVLEPEARAVMAGLVRASGVAVVLAEDRADMGWAAH